MSSHRIDGPALWRALDTQRRQRGLSWRTVARETGATTGSLFTRLQHDDIGLHSDALVSLLVWLGRAEPLHDLITPIGDTAAPAPERSKAAAALAHQLRHSTVAELDEALGLVGVTITLAVESGVGPS